MNHADKAWSIFERHFERIHTAQSISALAGWDMQTCMPEGAAAQRGRQLAYLETHVHGLMTDPELYESLRALADGGEPADPKLAWRAGAVRWLLKKVEGKRRIPSELVRESSEAEAKGFEVWHEARAKKDFAMFAPMLERQVDIKRRIARCLMRDGQSEYEALVDLFEPSFPLARINALLEAVRRELVPLVARIIENQKRRPAESGAGGVPLPRAEQERLNRRVLETMGFDFRHGRLDVAAHPFCGGAGEDIRLTTRYNDANWLSSLFAVIHEGGHGLYEQGMERLVPHASVREAPSFGMHESQSRLWENFIGRSRAFCDWIVDDLGVKAERLYERANRVAPSLIRVEADEATYNLHILLRFELEQAIFRGDLKIADLPGAWNEKMRGYLGVTPPDDGVGVLQDVHWSGGAFGYFPTYTLGNLIAAQLHERIGRDLDLERVIRAGELTRIRDWLNERVHAKGCAASTLTLVAEATGAELSEKAFVRYLERKYLDQAG